MTQRMAQTAAELDYDAFTPEEIDPVECIRVTANEEKALELARKNLCASVLEKPLWLVLHHVALGLDSAERLIDEAANKFAVIQSRLDYRLAKSLLRDTVERVLATVKRPPDTFGISFATYLTTDQRAVLRTMLMIARIFGGGRPSKFVPKDIIFRICWLSLVRANATQFDVVKGATKAMNVFSWSLFGNDHWDVEVLRKYFPKECAPFSDNQLGILTGSVYSPASPDYSPSSPVFTRAAYYKVPVVWDL
jgi:hypothetical protein